MSKARLYDIACASPLIVFYAFAGAGLVLQTNAQIAKHIAPVQLALLLGVNLAIAAFMVLQIVLFVIRRLPVGKAHGWWPRIAALFGSNSAALLLIAPRAVLPPLFNIASPLLIICGTVSSIVVASQLGRSFSVLPQARALVIDGPYRFVRHPLYLCEQISMFGLMLQFQQPWALVVFLLNLAAQFPRMHYEEQILAKICPTYAAYAERTARLVPGIY